MTWGIGYSAQGQGQLRRLRAARLVQPEKPGLVLDVAFVVGDALDIPFPLDTFDTVAIGFGIRNVPDFAVVSNRGKTGAQTRG